jgi:hypothetical protein
LEPAGVSTTTPFPFAPSIRLKPTSNPFVEFDSSSPRSPSVAVLSATIELEMMTGPPSSR